MSEYLYREARNETELAQLIRLRYAVYRADGGLDAFAPAHPSGMELDRFDLRSRHLGLFKVTEEGERPVGYMRVVEEGLVEGWKRVLSLSKEYPDLHEKVTDPPAPLPDGIKDFPATAHFLCPALQVALEAMKPGERLCDCGRFVVHPAERLDISLGRFATEAAIALYFMHLGYEHSVISCWSKHVSFYERYGYRFLDGAEIHSELRVPYALMWARPCDVPERFLPRLKSMAKAYEQHGCIYYDPSRPGDFRPPEALDQ